MEDNKWILITIIGVIALSLIAIGVYFLTAAVAPDPREFTDLNEVSEGASGVTTSPEVSSQPIGLNMAAVLEQPQVEQIEESIYKIVSAEESTNDQFEIFYFENDGGIIISLQSEPLALARRAAEAALLETTGFEQQALCDASVVVNTQIDISEQFAGRNLGLSFCESHVSLE